MYKNKKEDQLILRDELAIDRTQLANERTFLAYIRTALTLLIAGGTLLKFFLELYLQIIGMVFIGGGIAILLVGIIRFQKMHNLLQKEIPEKYQDL